MEFNLSAAAYDFVAKKCNCHHNLEHHMLFDSQNNRFYKGEGNCRYGNCKCTHYTPITPMEMSVVIEGMRAKRESIEQGAFIEVFK